MEAEQQRRKGQKRKLEEESSAASTASSSSDVEEEDETGDEEICFRRSQEALAREVRAQVEVLERAFSWNLADRAAAKRATRALAKLAKSEEAVRVIVEGGAVPALVKHLQEPPPLLVRDDCASGGDRPFEHRVEKWSAFALFLLATKPEYQQLIDDAGALPLLMNLLKRHKKGSNCRAVNGVIWRAAVAITNLAHENRNIKTYVRVEGGIPLLVQLLESIDVKVQSAAAGALRTLASKNESNKNQIVECKALPSLILMLQSVDPSVHYQAVGVIRNLVHSSPNIKKEVLLAGALQPVIGLLSSCCTGSQKEAALLLGQFASANSKCMVQIVQRGALRPLIEMLQSSDVQLKEMSAFALGRLAQDSHNQAGIVFNGGLVPLLKVLDSKNESLQHNAAFALFGIAENEDNVADFVKLGGVQRLQDGEFVVTQDCIANTLKRLEVKINGRVLMHLLYLMRVGKKAVQRCIALALAHLCPPDEQRRIFIDNNGIDILLELLSSANLKQQQDGLLALYKMASRAMMLSSVDAAPQSPTPRVYLGEQYVNNSTLSDVTFLVEGKCFYAHRIALLASSDAFRAMFDGSYMEKDARDIEILDIRWDIFELMMRYIYSGSVEINNLVAQDLLRAADQYLLKGLKRLCEYIIKQDVNIDNVSSMYELSETCNAISLRQTCILFILEQFEKLSILPGYCHLIQRIVPGIRSYFDKALKPNSKNSES
ncbi:ARM REPEAT PROTEIN INTERACTING WITH ABF2-like isoform X2 [Zingiber officinale]|uniref:ARM REPEAT PROTEIN INTERACTING WITH ABF2-like isoform X2 n=1 Tax=Zingiber officinale TaxID=94328 RepID=UPI001C4C2569|nr:ARM REPEAT PROTEIN INTERACTING WITH ABF2-like isoform X2 [Zingiber officinale]